MTTTPQELLKLYSGIECLFLDAPRCAQCPIGLAFDTLDSTNNRIWWYGADDTYEYKYLNEALVEIARFLSANPVHVIIGFSQGAALAAMVVSLLECRSNLTKADAIRAQNLPVDVFLRLPTQYQLKTVVCFSGYRGTIQFYNSLYRWQLDTPACHVIGLLDTIVDAEKTIRLARVPQNLASSLVKLPSCISCLVCLVSKYGGRSYAIKPDAL
ncbi:hypothetical protein EYZ11_004212 [Aspergillus tanneri]|uniref:Serine hydrolase domain-containing protein n=1 Tax=Aspergillus tanneri TaxID=1220188 RepID=A0A4S3JNH4_9EURO|nr:hypothetical protein EYZ11_004212 [Aspergillus tanneri]